MTSVGSIVGGAFRLVRQHPASVLIWGLLYVAAVVGLLFAMRPFFMVYAELVSQQLIAGANRPLNPQDLQPYLTRMQSAGSILFLAQIGVFALVMVLFTATQRAVLRPAERGFAFLRFGGDELRLIGLGFFLTVCLYIGTFLAVLGMMIVIAIASVASGSPVVAGLLFSIGFLALMGAMIYVEVRFSLAFPLTFLRRNFIVGEAWRLSKGRFWTLFGAYFVIGLVYLALATVLLVFAVAPFFLGAGARRQYAGGVPARRPAPDRAARQDRCQQRGPVAGRRPPQRDQHRLVRRRRGDCRARSGPRRVERNRTMMLLADTKKMVEEIVKSLGQAWARSTCPHRIAVAF